MTKEELFKTLKAKLGKLVEENGLLDRSVDIRCKALSPEEAIGNTVRRDFPILSGKEIMIQAEFDGAIGQSFTSAPSEFSGKLRDVLDFDLLNDDRERNIFIAVLNAVMRYLGLADRTIHCRNEEPETCAGKVVDWLKANYDVSRVLLVGYQPAMLENLAKAFELRVLDLNPEFVGTVRYSVLVEDGIKKYADAVDWAEIILCTGSTVGNGSMVDYIGLGKEVLFYGTSGAGAAQLLGLKRICFAH